MTIERDFKLFREQVPALINAAVDMRLAQLRPSLEAALDDRILHHLVGLRSQLTQLIDAKHAPTALPDPRIPDIIARLDTLTLALDRATSVSDLTARIDALDERLRRYLEIDRYTAARALIIQVLRSEDLLKEPAP